MNPVPDANDDAHLEALLRRAATPVPDDGFSMRVLAALPPAAEPSALWSRAVFCLAGAAVGGGFAYWEGASWPGLRADFAQARTAFANVSPTLADPLFAAAVTVTLLSLLVAFRHELRDRLLA